MYLILGIIIGLLLNPAKKEIITIIKEIEKNKENKGQSQFFEPISEEDKFLQANNITETLK